MATLAQPRYCPRIIRYQNPAAEETPWRWVLCPNLGVLYEVTYALMAKKYKMLILDEEDSAAFLKEQTS
jgi:hypothetical protein